ncbi:hypothetical protein J4573_04735 [Actinomadura barringtoniae]|uniref:Uncharacterized protein n=1 Tax=Actinomadura barringtoniae TaxID=1427535 RepID=A0A939P6T4_9ACTN|nr:hypothetical protein [Actinomadura barringtoniae]MBO2446385.1 hypothetical protein [Actinomadura barringtoniae]
MGGKSIFGHGAQDIVEPTKAKRKRARARELMADHYEQYLKVATNRNGRPFDPATIRA